MVGNVITITTETSVNVCVCVYTFEPEDVPGLWDSISRPFTSFSPELCDTHQLYWWVVQYFNMDLVMDQYPLGKNVCLLTYTRESDSSS